MNLKRVYFDYNIYDSLAKDRIHLPENYSQHFKSYVSVAHAEEFFTPKIETIQKKIMTISKS